MVLELDGYTIELDEHMLYPGHKAIGMGGPWECSVPAEGPEVEYVAARVIRNGKSREISPEALIPALERRLGQNWQQEARRQQ